MGLHEQPVGYFQSGSPVTDEYLASYTFLNGTQLPYPGMKGMICEFDQGTSDARNICQFQLVIAGAGITPAEGAVLYWLDKAAYTVTTVVAAGNLAGIAPALMTAAASAFWMIKKGDDKVLFIAAPTVVVAAGLPVVASATAGKADALANVPAQAAFPLIGVALGATAADLATVRINIPDTF